MTHRKKTASRRATARLVNLKFFTTVELEGETLHRLDYTNPLVKIAAGAALMDYFCGNPVALVLGATAKQIADEKLSEAKDKIKERNVYGIP